MGHPTVITGAVGVSQTIAAALEDQHMEWKPAGQPEHASLNQCQLIVANRCSGHPPAGGWR